MEKEEEISTDKKGQFSVVSLDSPNKQKAKQKALDISIREGASASAATSLGTSYVTPFALALNAQPIHIGFLSSFSGLLGPLAQIFGTKLMRKSSRKSIVMKFVLLESLMWLPIALISLAYWKGMLEGNAIYALILVYSAMVIFGSIATPAWFSWMGDLVPDKERGRYFAKRNRITGLIGLIAALAGAFFLDFLKTKGFALAGFAILFSLAFVFRIRSFLLFHKQFSPKFKQRKRDYFSFFDFVKRRDNYGKFAMYQGIFHISLMIASPFFAVYMLNNLKFSYTTFMIVSMSTTGFYLLFQPLAGRFSDRFGNKKLLAAGNFLFATYPLFWIFIKSPFYLIIMPQLVSGIANAAWTIGTNNFTYDSASPRHRGICISYMNLFIGIGTFIGAIVGGLLIKNISIGLLSSFFAIFLVSAVLRLGSALWFTFKIKEIRDGVEKFPRVHIDIIHPFRTIQAEIGWFKTVFK